MIPLRLELSNFLSYRETATLDFHGLHLACIAGSNGAGKSSILDAITWALFGNSRTKSDDDVVNRQAYRANEAALVEFSFELEGNIYKAIRSKRAGRPVTLEFQMAAPDGGWKSLSETGVRRTQAAIEALLKMNYDIFINASFLLQGKADEFTTKTANKRKEILADLLGVSEWDRYKEAAAERRKDIQNRLVLLDARLQEIDEELAERPAREAALAAASEALTLISEQLALHEQILQERRRTESVIEQQKQTVAALARNQADAQRSLADLEQLLAKRREERAQIKQLLDQAKSIEEAFETWQQDKTVLAAWQQKADAYSEIQQKKRPHELRLERERTRLEQRKLELERQSRNIQALTGRREELGQSVIELKQRLEQLSLELDEVGARESAWNEAKQELQKLQASRDLLAQEQSQLAAQQAKIKARQEEQTRVMEKRAAAADALAKIEAELAAMAEHEHRLVEANKEIVALKSEQPLLREKMNELDDRIKQLDSQSGGSCPLCGQELSDDHRLTILNDLRTEGKEFGDKWRQNRARLQALAEEAPNLEAKTKGKKQLERNRGDRQQDLALATARLEEIDKAIESWSQVSEAKLEALNRALADDSVLQAQSAMVSELATAAEIGPKLRAEREALQAKFTTAEANIAQIDGVLTQWESSSDEDGAGSRAELSRVSGRLEANEISAADQAALAELNRSAVAIGYDPQQHQSLKNRFDELVGAERRHQELLQARAAMKPLEDGLQDLEGRLKAQQSTLEETSHQLKESEAALESLTTGVADLTEIENKVQDYREKQIEAHRREETAQQGVKVLEDLRLQRKQLAAERQEQTQLIRRLQLLEKACGREGVQALLIERALPEIEDDANELLDRLSGGQMQVIFDTQRKLKTSDRLAETLDIRIVDSAGERPYENYSGGEQFRVNFAIRLALSKILTRRAGARLQTLVIDEGFGSQDPAGRQRLVEAINIVQDDFERVLVITHIDELRDAFPNRIEVEKGPQGSTIQVI